MKSFQFSLRELLFFIFMVACLLGWVNSCSGQKEEIEKIQFEYNARAEKLTHDFEQKTHIIYLQAWYCQTKEGLFLCVQPESRTCEPDHSRLVRIRTILHPDTKHLYYTNDDGIYMFKYLQTGNEITPPVSNKDVTEVKPDSNNN